MLVYYLITIIFINPGTGLLNGEGLGHSPPRWPFQVVDFTLFSRVGNLLPHTRFFMIIPSSLAKDIAINVNKCKRVIRNLEITDDFYHFKFVRTSLPTLDEYNDFFSMCAKYIVL